MRVEGFGAISQPVGRVEELGTLFPVAQQPARKQSEPVCDVVEGGGRSGRGVCFIILRVCAIISVFSHKM